MNSGYGVTVTIRGRLPNLASPEDAEEYGGYLPLLKRLVEDSDITWCDLEAVEILSVGPV